MSLKLFLDSAAFISGVLTSNEGDPMRRIIALGEKKVFDLRISREVEGDVERIVNKRNPALLPIVAQIIITGNIATVSNPNEDTIDRCLALTGRLPDARILAAALECAADALVTYDCEHLIDNPKIKPPDADILVMKPKDAVEWCFEQYLASLGKK